MKNVGSVYGLSNLIKQMTCSKNSKNASHVNLIFFKKNALIFSKFMCYIRFSQNDYFYPKSLLSEVAIKSYQIQKFLGRLIMKILLVLLQPTVSSQNSNFWEKKLKKNYIYHKALKDQAPRKKYLQETINHL